MKQRLREMDLIRAFAALSIIAIHVSAPYVNVSRPAYYLNQLVRFAVPLFILISGLLLHVSDKGCSSVKDYFAFLGRRLRKVFIPYVIWTLIYIAYNLRHELGSIWSDKGAFLSDTGRKLLYGSASAHLYFVVIIIQLYLLFPLLSYLMKRWSKAVLAVSFLLTLFYQTGEYLYIMRLINFPYFLFPNYEFFPTWIFFFVFGMYFASRLEEWRARLHGMLPHIAVFWLVSLALLLLDSRLTDTYSSSMKPSIILYCITSFLLFFSVSQLLKDKTHALLKTLDWLSAQSFLIYLAHLLVMNVLVGKAWFLGFNIHDKGFPGMLALYAGTLAGSALFAYVVSLTPVASLLGAAATRKKKPSPPDIPSSAKA